MNFSIVDATVPFEVPFALPTEGLGIVETLEEHFEIMNLEVDIPEDYVGPFLRNFFCKFFLLQNHNFAEVEPKLCGRR
jgi:hypothetical protein